MYKKSKHKYRTQGFYLDFPNGHKWSCVNLAAHDHECMLPLSEEGKRIVRMLEFHFDRSGGRFEAMLYEPDGDGVNPDHQVRAHSFEDLFKGVEEYEKENFKNNS